MAWWNPSIAPPRASNQRMIGVGSTVPVPESSESASDGASSSATSASPATVRCSKTSRTANPTPAERARLTRRIETMLSPPRTKKSSSHPTRSTPSAWANNSPSSRSRAVRGSRLPASTGTTEAGAGSAAASSLPLAVNGKRSSVMNADGTM